MSESQAMTIPASETAQSTPVPHTNSVPVEVTGTEEQASSPVTRHVSFRTPGAPDNSPMSSHRQDTSTAISFLSEFQSFIPNIPWQTGFWPGAGINAFTGQVEPQAVVPFKLATNEIKQSREYFSTIHYESNLMQELAAHAGAGATMNIGPVGVGVDASASLVSRAKVSATSSSVLATYITTYNSDFELASGAYKLQPEAAELAQKDPAEFRRRHGDYFVAGGQRSSTFTALLVFSCTNQETLKKFASNVTASVSDLFKAVGSVEWAEEAKQANVDIKVYVEMRGFKGTPPSAGENWDASKVAAALDWFKSNEVGDYSIARLQHYSALDPHISRIIPISGDIFKDIRRLNLLLQSISILSGSCPQTRDLESMKLVAAASELAQEVDARQSALATDHAICATFLKTAEALNNELSVIHRRYSFWVQVLNKLPEQPTVRIHAVKNLQIWSYGLTSYAADSSIDIQPTRHRLVIPSRFSPFPVDETLSYAGDRMIVGWKIIAVRNDGYNGSWRKLSRSALLSTSARITFRTERFRSAEWEFVTYHVDRRLLNFSTSGMDGVSLDDNTDEQTMLNPFGSLSGNSKLPNIGSRLQ